LVHQRRVIRGSIQLCIANDVVTEIATKHADARAQPAEETRCGIL